MALSFDDAFHVMVVAALVGAVMGVLPQRNRAAHAATAPEAQASHSKTAQQRAASQGEPAAPPKS